jgi:hypothetical protein
MDKEPVTVEGVTSWNDVEIAHDFRRQLQERYPDYAGDRTAEDVAGWTKKHANLLKDILHESWDGRVDDSLLKTLQAEVEAIKLTNPRDEPFTHAIVKKLCEEIEESCKEFGISLRSGVSFGVAPTFELSAERYPVHFAESSVVTISAGLISFCSHISKVISLSLICEPDAGKFRICNEPKRIFAKIGSDTDLKRFWTEVIGGYAYGSGPLQVSQRTIPYPQSIVRGQLLRAMERFAIAHEYAHHIANHGKANEASVDGDPTSKRDEFHADIFALGLNRYMERNEQQPNFYAISGAGAVLLLKTLECVRKARQILSDGHETLPSSGTHPETAARIRHLDTLDSSLPEEEQVAFRQTRDDFVEIVDCVWLKLREWYLWMYKDGLRPEIEPSASA